MGVSRRRVSVGVAGLSLMADGALGVPIEVAGAAGSNLIVNGSFETPDIPTGSFGIFPAIPGWAHAPRAGTTSSGIEIQDRVFGAPAEGAGDQFVELDSDGPSHVFQDVATNPGAAYRLTFLYSPRPLTTAVQNHFSVSAGPESVEIGPLASAARPIWVGFTLDFVATAASSRIEFLDLGPEEETGGLGAWIDEIEVTPLNSAPDCSAVSSSPEQVDRGMRDQFGLVTLSGASDPDGDALSFHIDGVAQDEPVSGVGTGDGTSPDAQLTPAGADSNQVLVRAERNPRGNGRVYRIAYTVSDGNGGSCHAGFADTTATVAVPRQKGASAVDDFATTRFDSFTGEALP